MSTVTLPPGNIFIGHGVVDIDGKKYPVDISIDTEWMFAFNAMVERSGGVIAPSSGDIVGMVAQGASIAGYAPWGSQADDGRDSYVAGVPGAQGERGEQGISGPPGRDGDDGPDRYILINP